MAVLALFLKIDFLTQKTPHFDPPSEKSWHPEFDFEPESSVSRSNQGAKDVKKGQNCPREFHGGGCHLASLGQKCIFTCLKRTFF